jgi:hypothetical protein
MLGRPGVARSASSTASRYSWTSGISLRSAVAPRKPPSLVRGALDTRAQFSARAILSLVGWAAHYIAKLKDGVTVQFRPRGASMKGRVESGQLVTVEPVDPATLVVGDIVLCKVNGNEYLHIVKAIQGERFQIGNNRGLINGWITARGLFGKCVRIEP